MITPGWSETVFADALKAGTLSVPAGLEAWNRVKPAKRFAVYRNNVRGALVEALAARYPVVQRLVGEDFFRIMAREFALANLPASPVLIGYGANFPEFIAAFAPAASLPYLPDVARLESAYWQAYHAADDEPAAINVFQNLDPEVLSGLRFGFVAASFVVPSHHPIASIWQTNAIDAEVRPVDLSIAEDALISRPAMSVEVRKLPAGAAPFISGLQAGKTLPEAADAGFSSSPAFDLAKNFGGLIQARIVKWIS